MKPTPKNPEINALVDAFAPHPRVSSIEADTCTWCGKPATDFRNPISRREYRISGSCQKCQDDIFGKD